MKSKQILLVDTRIGETRAKIDEEQFRESAAQLSIELDVFSVPETALEKAVNRVAANDHYLGMIFLRSAESSTSSLELESFFSAIDIPVVELFLDDLGHHKRIDQPVSDRKIIRTIYGRGERGVFWAMHFLLHCRDHPYQTIAYGTLASQLGDLMLPEGPGPHPVVMLIHGGFWRDAYYRDSTHGIAADLAKRGIAVWNIEYRRVGRSGGGFPETHQDVLQALNFLETIAKTHPLDLNRVGVVGHSAGGYLSTWAGSIPNGKLAAIMPEPQIPVALSISLAGVTDLDEAHLHGGGEQAATHFLKEAAEQPILRQQLSIGYLTYAPGTRLILAHGTLDEYVPVELSEHTFQLLQERNAPGELLIFPNTGHNEFVDPESEVWQNIAGKITEGLKKN